MNYPFYQNPFQPAPDQLQQYRMTQYQQMNPVNADERIWVQGEGGAAAYLVAPNSFVRLWDSTAPVYYEKRADASGRPYMEVYEYKRKGSNSPSQEVLQNECSVDYMKLIKGLEERIEALEGGINHDE